MCVIDPVGVIPFTVNQIQKLRSLVCFMPTEWFNSEH